MSAGAFAWFVIAMIAALSASIPFTRHVVNSGTAL